VSGRAGIELTPTVVRLVRLAPFTGRAAQTLEIPWDPRRPHEAVADLRAKVGSIDAIALAVGLGFLEVARLDLPPVSPSERAKIVELEPDRYFAAGNRERLVITIAPDEPIAFAAPASLVESWIAAFETWAPVESVDATPLSIARSLGAAQDGTFAIEAAGDEVGLLQIARGRIASVRRTMDKRVAADARSMPAVASVSGSFIAALGAARPHGAVVSPLAPDEWRRRAATRRRMRTAANVVAVIAAVFFAVWAADRWRERTLVALRSRVSDVESRGAAADSALRVLRSRENEARMISDIAASRADPHAGLAAISAALPRDATVLTARATGNEWQIDGTTSDASALVPLLDRHERFDSVRFLSASSRYRDASRSYETFSIAFRFRP
jgi:hypothetical protein